MVQLTNRKLDPAPADAPWPVVSLNNAFKKFEIDAVARSVMIREPLLRFIVELGQHTTPESVQKESLRIGMEMKSTGEPIVLPSKDKNGAFDGNVRVEMQIGAHPTVRFDDLSDTAHFTEPEILKENAIPILLGATDVDVPLLIDLQKAPHLMVAGVTGSGKTQILHAIIRSCETHSETHGIRLVLIDPKKVDFTAYANSKALRYDIVQTSEGGLKVLQDLNEDLDKRLDILAKGGFRDILEYRAAGHKMPFIVVVIDELAELVKNEGFAALLCSVAARSRAGGIHFAVGTQHPVRTIITGLLKAQFPTRIATRVATHTHSRVAIDQNGAEKLLGKGDALLLREDGSLTRFKGAFTPPASRQIAPRPVPKISPETAKRAVGMVGMLKALAALVAQPRADQAVRRKKPKKKSGKKK